MKTNLSIIKNLITEKNINLNKDFFQLSSSELSNLDDLRRLVKYNYSSPTGRSVLRSFYYSVQRNLNK